MARDKAQMKQAVDARGRQHAGQVNSGTAGLSGFAPISRADARMLVLGSMPGVASLQAQQYYAHPRNAFWPLLGDVFGFDAAAAYSNRVAALVAHQVAVWDVLQSCQRAGSLDADIVRASVVANDFAGFFVRHTQIQRVCFNGAMVETLYRRHVAPHLGLQPSMEFVRLASTSPAHAGMTLSAKRLAWQAVHPLHPDVPNAAR